MGEKLSVNPWVGMWVRPRETIRAIVQFNPSYLYPLLCLLYGFPLLLQAAQNFAMGDRFPVAGILGVAFVLAIIIGAVVINISAGLFYWTGKWIGATGSFLQIRSAVAWSSIPSVINILIWFINIGVFGKRLFSSGFAETPFVGGELSMIFLTSLVQAVIAIWAFIMLLKALGEVQGFSAWKALLNVLIPFFVIFIGVSILGWLMTLLTGTPH